MLKFSDKMRRSLSSHQQAPEVLDNARMKLSSDPGIFLTLPRVQVCFFQQLTLSTLGFIRFN